MDALIGVKKEFAVFAVSGEGAGSGLIAISDVEGASEGAGEVFPGGANGAEIVDLPLFDPVAEVRK
mgnify:CR=1 FL=1